MCVDPGELTVETVPQAQRPPPAGGGPRGPGAVASAAPSQAQSSPPAPGRGEGLGALRRPTLGAGLEERLRGYPGNTLGSPPLDSRLNGYSQGRHAASAPGPLRDWPPQPCPFWSGARPVHRRLCSRRPGSTWPVWLPRRLLRAAGVGRGPAGGWRQCVWGIVCVQCVGRAALLGASGGARCSSVTRLCPLTMASAPQEPSLRGALGLCTGAPPPACPPPLLSHWGPTASPSGPSLTPASLAQAPDPLPASGLLLLPSSSTAPRETPPLGTSSDVTSSMRPSWVSRRQRAGPSCRAFPTHLIKSQPWVWSHILLAAGEEANTTAFQVLGGGSVGRRV